MTSYATINEAAAAYAAGSECASRVRHSLEEGDLPARYHIDLANGQDVIRDEEGVEADDLAQMIEQAQAGIEEMRANGDFQGVETGWSLVVRDAEGLEIKRIRV